MTVVSVIIPFYQKRPGILKRALTSILEQKLPENVQVNIIVVDDGSPTPARLEMQGLTFAPPFYLNMMVQPNAGVAAARNMGLKLAAKDTTYIAFLDSDDIWHSEYLGTALAALDSGYDFYFCDTQKIGVDYTSFSERPFDDYLSSPNAKPVGNGLYEVEKKSFFDHSLRGRVFRIPAIVYRRSIAPDLEFSTSLLAAGEDCLFLFHIIEKSGRICCSPQVLVTLGDGINMFAGKYTWDNPGHLIQKMGHLLAFYEWRKSLVLSDENDLFLVNRIKNVRRLFAFLSVRYVFKYKKLWPAELVKMIGEDPQFWLWYPCYALYITASYLIHSYDPLKDSNTFRNAENAY